MTRDLDRAVAEALGLVDIFESKLLPGTLWYTGPDGCTCLVPRYSELVAEA